MSLSTNPKLGLKLGLKLDLKRIQAQIHLPSLKENFRILSRKANSLDLIPMVKANAYGHGAESVAEALALEPKLFALGVATFEEAARLRERAALKTTPIIVFGTTSPWEMAMGDYCQEDQITPAIVRAEDVQSFFEQRKTQNWDFPYHLKFNTGMNRLGISYSERQSIFDQIDANDPPEGIFSHLGLADEPHSSLTQGQVEQFKTLAREAKKVFPQTKVHLGNSAALWNANTLELESYSDLARPGLSLYGVRPFPGASKDGLKAVLTLRASVAQVHRLAPGDWVGYGATQKADRAMEIATLHLGYADGLHRALSSRGHVWTGHAKEPFWGRVSMDLSTIKLTATLQAGDWVELLGPNLDIWEQAELAQTIPYEILTSIGNRVERIYLD